MATLTLTTLTTLTLTLALALALTLTRCGPRSSRRATLCTASRGPTRRSPSTRTGSRR